MKKVSKITNDSLGNIRIKSEYLNNGIVGVNKKLQSEFNSFLILLAMEDAKYNEDSIKNLCNRWERVTHFITTNSDLEKVKKQIKKIASIGQLGEMIYDLFNINSLNINNTSINSGYIMFKHECNATINECNEYLNTDSDDFLEFYINELVYLDSGLDDYSLDENIDKKEISDFKNKIKRLLKCIKDKIDSKKLNNDIIINKIDNKGLYDSLSHLVAVYKEQLKVPSNDLEYRPIDYALNTIFYIINNKEEFDLFIDIINKIKIKDEIGYSIYNRFNELYELNNYDDLNKLIEDNKSMNITEKNFTTDRRNLFNIYFKNFNRIVNEINKMNNYDEDLLIDYLNEIQYIKSKIIYCKKAITDYVYDNLEKQIESTIEIMQNKLNSNKKTIK